MVDEKTATIQPQEPATNFQEYQARLAAAKDETEFLSILAEVSKQKAAIAKAKVDQERREAEALAGERSTLEAILWETLKGVVKAEDLLKVKAKAFTVTVDHKEDAQGHIDPKGEVKVSGGVKLVVPTIKARKTGGGGGAGVSTSDEIGIGLSDLFDQYANDEERVKVATIDADDALTDKAKNSKKWQVKTKAKKRILADNPNLIKK